MVDDIGPKERLLAFMTAHPTESFHGYRLIKETGVQSGTLYPQLARWVQQGILEHHWEPRADGRPPRKSYRLTGDGVAAARLELAALRASHNRTTSAGITGVAKPAIGGAG
jgi:PadR family transcriptional regulator PadR